LTLIERPAAASNGWRNLKLTRAAPPDAKRTKRTWWLGWNGERLARNNDARWLSKREPETYEWIISTLTR
jgi:hypothetical protein